MPKTREIKVKKVADGFEVTITITEIIVEKWKLAEMEQQKIDLESSKASLISSQSDSLAVHNDFIAEKQKQIDDAIALGP